MTRHRLAIALPLVAGLLSLAAVTSASAAEERPYSPSAMQAAQAAGKPVVVDVTAPWCTTCKAQAPLVKAILAEPKFKNLVLLHVDFDSQKAVLRKYNVRMQSTFVVFKGKHEVGRSTGATAKGSIQKLFDKAS